MLTKSLTKRKFVNLLHFLPALLCYLAYLPFFTYSLDRKISIIANGGSGFQPVFSASLVLIMASGILYVLLTSLMLHRHRKAILDQFSYTQKINLRWLEYLTYGIGVIWIFIIFSKDEIIFGVAALFILFVGYFGVKQVGIFTQQHAVPAEPVADVSNPIPERISRPGNNETQIQHSSSTGGVNKSTAHVDQEARNKKYSKSGLTIESANELHRNLTQVMQTEKLYKESDLTLVQLAKRLHTHPNHLSQVINNLENKNFFDYINTLRTQEFIELVAKRDNQQYTLLGMAYECGFNSKSSFNKYFRKITGKSPSEYLESQKNSLS